MSNNSHFRQFVFSIVIVLVSSVAFADEPKAEKPPTKLFNVWGRCLADLETPEGQRALPILARWETIRLNAGLTVCSAQTPVITGDKLVYRDLHRLHVADLSTGAIVASYEYSRFPFAKSSVFVPTFADRYGRDPGPMRQYLVGSSFHGLFGVDGRWVYFNSPNLQGMGEAQMLSRIDVDDRPESPLPTWQLRSEQNRPGDPDPVPLTATWKRSFFGVPLASGRHLYCTTQQLVAGEDLGQLCIDCFDRDTRELIWRREISPAVHSSDHGPSYAMCLAGDVLVAQTEDEHLVGLVPMTGEVVWRYKFPVGKRDHRFAKPGGCPSVPLVAGSLVLHLPMFGDKLHCFDAGTGKAKWTSPRDDKVPEAAAEYVATATADAAILVSHGRCRALSLADGALKWEHILPAAPSGRGVRLGDSYLIPLGREPLLFIDLSSGKATELAWPVKHSIPGNLVASGDFIVSLGRTDVRVVSSREPAADPARPQYEPPVPMPTVEEVSAGKPPTVLTADPTGKIVFKATSLRGEFIDAKTEKPTGLEIAIKGRNRNMVITCWAFSPDGKSIAVGAGWKGGKGAPNSFGEVGVFEVGTGKLVMLAPKEPGFVHKVGFSENGREVFYEADKFEIDGP